MLLGGPHVARSQPTPGSPPPALATTGAADHGTAPSAPRSDSVAVFLARLRAATARFRDHAAAVAAGYRWMGPDMPNMGEHWINPRLVVQRAFDPMRPSCLSYVRVGEARVLTGVAYIVPVRPGTAPPRLPVAAGTWHYHDSTLDQEAFTRGDPHRHAVGPSPHHAPPNHRESAPTGSASREAASAPMTDAVEGPGREPMLAMMHVWAWTDNPGGVFQADNWGLSYARFDLPLPASPRPRAALALFLLADDGPAYYRKVLRVNARPTPDEAKAVRTALQDGRRAIRRVLDAGADAPIALDAALAEAWGGLWASVRPRLRPAVWAAIEPVVLPPR
jgi:hypothetical protein